MSFSTKDEKLLEKYNEVWKKVSNITKKEFDSKPVYNEKHLKTKAKSHNGKFNTTFHNSKIPLKALKSFQKNVNMLIKKKKRQSLLLMTQKFLLMILIEKF